MAFLVSNQYGLRPTSSRVTVADNDVARLMYYLHCVFSAIEYTDQDVRRYRNYQNWSFLSDSEQRVVLILALALSPDEFDGKVFFQSDALCGDLGNKFYELSKVSHQLLAVQSIVVAGQTRRVTQIMTYKMSWMQHYYIEPIKRLAYRFSPQGQYEEAQRRRAATARATRPTYTYSNSPSNACVIS